MAKGKVSQKLLNSSEDVTLSREIRAIKTIFNGGIRNGKTGIYI